MKHQEWLLDFQTKRDDADRKWRQEQAEREHQREQERTKADQDWREKQAKADQDWREKQAKAEHEWQRTQGQWHDDESKTDSKRYAMTLALSIIAAIVFQGIIAMLGIAIQAGWFSRPW